MENTYQVLTTTPAALEATLNTAYADGWELIALAVARLRYGLGAEYQATELLVTLRRREQAPGEIRVTHRAP